MCCQVSGKDTLQPLTGLNIGERKETGILGFFWIENAPPQSQGSFVGRCFSFCEWDAFVNSLTVVDKLFSRRHIRKLEKWGTLVALRFFLIVMQFHLWWIVPQALRLRDFTTTRGRRSGTASLSASLCFRTAVVIESKSNTWILRFGKLRSSEVPWYRSLEIDQKMSSSGWNSVCRFAITFSKSKVFCAPSDIGLRVLKNKRCSHGVWAITTVCFRVRGGPFSCVNHWRIKDRSTDFIWKRNKLGYRKHHWQRREFTHHKDLPSLCKQWVASQDATLD